jgi:hypothetical protein
MIGLFRPLLKLTPWLSLSPFEQLRVIPVFEERGFGSFVFYLDSLAWQTSDDIDATPDFFCTKWLEIPYGRYGKPKDKKTADRPQ